MDAAHSVVPLLIRSGPHFPECGWPTEHHPRQRLVVRDRPCPRHWQWRCLNPQSFAEGPDAHRMHFRSDGAVSTTDTPTISHAVPTFDAGLQPPKAPDPMTASPTSYPLCWFPADLLLGLTLLLLLGDAHRNPHRETHPRRCRRPNSGPKTISGLRNPPDRVLGRRLDKLKSECKACSITPARGGGGTGMPRPVRPGEEFHPARRGRNHPVPCDGKTVIPTIRAANAASIPVVLYNRLADLDGRPAHHRGAGQRCRSPGRPGLPDPQSAPAAGRRP